MAPLEPGDPRRVGRYRLLGRLGEGGMGRVYLGASPGGRAVAIKVVRPELAGDPAFRARFRAEAAAARRVGGAFTSPVVDADPDGAVPWLATAYVHGPSLKDAVARYGPLPEPGLRTLGAGLGEALTAIHQAGVLHRDLKPANILLAKDGPRIIDFGISRTAGGTALTAEGEAIGSPGYMSPEQLRGGDLSTAADVFAFAAVLAFAATGRPPYGTGPVATVIHRTLHERPDLDGVPESLTALVAAGLSADPARRPPAALLPRLLAAPPAGPGWLPDPVGREIDQAERTLALDLRAVSRATTRRRFLLGGAAAAGLAAAGGGTALVLARTADRTADPAPRLLWRATAPLNAGETAAPAVFPRAVTLAGAGYQAAGYDAGTGRRLWTAEIDGQTGPGRIYAKVRKGAGLVALDPYARARRWSAALPDGYIVSTMTGPVGGLLAVLDDRGTIIGIDARTGERRWTYRAPADTELQGIQGGALFAVSGTDYGLSYARTFALDAATGRVRWTSTRRTPGLTLPGGGAVFSGSAHRDLTLLSAATGRPVWTATLPDDAGDLHYGGLAITVANGMAYLAGTTLYALDLATGRRRWAGRPAIPGGSDRTFLIAGGRAYVNDDHRLLALDARTGRRRWSAETPAGDRAPLRAAGGLICTGAAETTGPGLYGWDAATGRLVWRHAVPSASGGDQWKLTTAGGLLVAAHGATLLAFRLP